MIHSPPVSLAPTVAPQWTRLGLPILVVLSACWCVFLWSVRAWRTESGQYFYLVYNLALAAIPFGLSAVATRLESRKAAFPVMAVWLLFFPNAPYLLTDLIHLRPRGDAPFWFDWLLLVSFAGSGFLVGCYSLFQVHRRFRDWWGGPRAWLAVAAIWSLSSFGIYLGRFPRWNSWDVVFRPGAFLSDVFHRLTHPLEHPVMVCYTGGLALVLLAGYAAVASGWLAIVREPETASWPPGRSRYRRSETR